MIRREAIRDRALALRLCCTGAARIIIHHDVSPHLIMRFLLTCTLVAVTAGIFLPSAMPQQQAAAQLEARSVEAQFAEAYGLFANQLYREAIHGFATFRSQHPDHVNAADALYYQAEASLAVGQEDEAVGLFRRLERDYPFHPLASKSRLALGKYFYTSAQYARAIDVLGQVVEDRPTPDVASKALYWMGESALHSGQDAEALRYFRRAADDYRDTETAPVALYTVGFTQVRQQQYDAAAEAFEQLAARYPDSPYSRNIGLALAEVYYELDDFHRTIAEINRRMPDLSEDARERATFLLAESYNQLRDSDNAIIYYRRFTESSPSSPYYRRALYGLAWNYYFEDAHQWAAEHFARAREGHGDDLAARATYYEAVNQRLAAQPEETLSLLELFIDRWPQHELAPQAYFELAVGYYDQRRWRDAAETFSRVAEEYPESGLTGEALYYRGNTDIALGEFDDAMQNFERAIELDAAPASLKEELRFQRAWLMYRNRDYAEAARAFMSLHEQGPQAGRGAESLFWAAESYYQLDELNRATELFQQYLRQYSGGEHVEAAHYALGWTNFRQRDYAEAATEFTRFLEAYRGAEGAEFVPYRTDALLRLADSYYALKRYADAIRTYRQVADKAGDYALYQIAQAFYNSGEAFDAISAFRNLRREYPDTEWAEEAQYNLGYIFFQNADYDQAIVEYQTLIDSYPQDPLAAKAQYGIGDALFNAGQSEEAIQAYRVVLERYPESTFVADAAAGIQYALIASGDEDGAGQAVEEFIAEHPDSPVADELRFRQAEVAYQSGRMDQALADLQQFVRTSNSETLLPEAYFYLGSIYRNRGQRDEAISYLKPIADRFASSNRFPDAAQLLGELYLEEQQPQDALALYRKLESTPNNDARLLAEARYGQAMALLQLDRQDEAERLLENAIRAAPDAPETLPASLGLARVYEGSNRYEDAARLYRQVVDRSRDELGAEALYRLGVLLIDRGDARGAVEELGRMPVLFPGFNEWIARGYLEQARAFQSLGQTGDATSVYDRIIREFSGTPYARTAEQEKEAL